MFASVTDSRTLAMIWNRGYDALDNSPSPDPRFDLQSVLRQLADANARG